MGNRSQSEARWTRAATATVATTMTMTTTGAVTALEDCPPVGAAAVLVAEGDDAPQTDRAFQRFDRACADAHGAIAFTADLDGPTDADDVLYADGLIAAREGWPAWGTEGVFDDFEPFGTAQQLAGGTLGFIATLRDVAPGTERAVFAGGAVVARQGDAPAGLGGDAYEDFASVGVLEDGRVGFLARLDGPVSTDSALVLDGAVLLRKGDAVPGLPDEHWDGRFDEVQWNGRGDLLFEGNTSLPADQDRVIMRRTVADDGTVTYEVLLQEGQLLDTGKDLHALDLVEQCALASDGTWAVRGLLRDLPTTLNDVVVGPGGVLAVEGDPVDALPGAILGRISAVAAAPGGRVAWLADLEGSVPDGTDEGLFVDGCLVLVDGSGPLGLPDGTTLVDLGFEDLVMDGRDRAILSASFSGPASGDGIFVRDGLAAPCPGDVDGSGDVALGDVLVVAEAWGPCGGPVCPADVDADGNVGFDDLVAVLAAWGPCPE